MTILIPVLNQEKMLGRTIKEIRKVVKNPEIIVLYDVTKPELKNFALGEARKLGKAGVQTIFRFNVRGFGSALRIGFENSAGERILVMMGDMCDDPKTIPKMMEKMDSGFDIVAGSRFMKGGGIIGSPKGQLSNVVSKAISIFSNAKSSDITNAFRMYSRKVAENVKTETNSFDITTELTLKAASRGFRIGEVPTVWKNQDLEKTTFSVTKEAKRYFRHFLFAAFSMPSALTKILILLFMAAVLFFAWPFLNLKLPI